MQGARVQSLVKELDHAHRKEHPTRGNKDPRAATKTPRSQINKY